MGLVAQQRTQASELEVKERKKEQPTRRQLLRSVWQRISNRKICQYVCKTKQSIGHECGAHPIQLCTPERTEALATPADALGRLTIALRAMWPPALLPISPTSRFPGVPDSNTYSSLIPNFILRRATKNPAVQNIAQQNIIDSKDPLWRLLLVHCRVCLPRVPQSTVVREWLPVSTRRPSIDECS